MQTTRLLLLSLITLSLSMIGCDSDDVSEPVNRTPGILLSPQELNIPQTQSATLELAAENIPDTVFALSLAIDYDGAILEYSTYVSDGDDVFGAEAIEFVHADSALYLSFSRTNMQSAVSPNGRICSITFTPRATGTSNLTFRGGSVVFYDRNGEEIDIEDLVEQHAVVIVN
jgi:hypothetical protein